MTNKTEQKTPEGRGFLGDLNKVTKNAFGVITGGHKTNDNKEAPAKKAAPKAAASGANTFDTTIDQWSDDFCEAWDDLLDKLEAGENENVQWFSKNFLRRLSIEAPVIVGFVFLCVVLHMLNMTVMPGISKFCGVDDFFQPTNPIHYMRMITHIFAHDGIPHLRGNMTNILLVGPSSEAVFGSKVSLKIMLVVAISSGIAHVMIGPKWSRQLGASGVVFALILLNSLVSAKRGRIPLSFVLTAFMWLGDELWKLCFARDGVSHHAHLVGGIVGSIAGYVLQQNKESDRVTKNAASFMPGLTKKKV